MEMCDVIVVGAGPAGGQCARELAVKGKKVILLEKAKTFLENNYSSGGAPHAIMQEFDLPLNIAGTHWNTLRVSSSRTQSTWDSPTSLGPVLDFDKLRTFLADQVLQNGGQVYLGHTYLSHTKNPKTNSIEVKVKDLHTQQDILFKSRVLVDATGSERKVLAKEPQDDTSMVATGIEHHVRVAPEIYQKYANSLNFFLGTKWMPQGYAWIFPMAPNQLKVGVIRYFQNEYHVPHHPSYRHYLDQMLSLCGTPETRETLDKHGKTIYYSLKQQDKRYEGPVLAIGDAVSCINPLGCEGIRHALVSGRLAAQTIEDFLEKKKTDLSGYDRALNKYFGRKWFFCEKMMDQLFTTPDDQKIDCIVHSFQYMNTQQVLDVVFNYRFSRGFKSYYFYLLERAKSWFIKNHQTNKS
jgi:digeranylgeranylglycerophospholipid reductase